MQAHKAVEDHKQAEHHGHRPNDAIGEKQQKQPGAQTHNAARQPQKAQKGKFIGAERTHQQCCAAQRHHSAHQHTQRPQAVERVRDQHAAQNDIQDTKQIKAALELFEHGGPSFLCRRGRLSTFYRGIVENREAAWGICPIMPRGADTKAE